MIKPKMSVAEAVLQLIRGFKKVTGREPSGLELIKIQQEAVQRLKELEKVVDMQGNVIDTSKGIMGGRQIQDNKEFGEALKKALMEKDNPYSDLVKTTEKGPKTLEQRRKEAQKALQNKNVVPIEGKILDKQIKQEFDKGMKEGKFKDIRLRDGREIKSEEDFREYIDELNEDSNFATGGRAGYRFGIGPLLKRLSQKSPKKAYTDYLKSVKDRAQKGDVKSLAPELGAVSATGILVNRRMKDVLENMNNQEKEIDLQNYIKELNEDPFYKKYPELKDKMIEGYTEMLFGEKRADGGRAGFNNGGAPSIKYDFDREGPAGPLGPPFETNDPEEAAREIIRRIILSEPGLRSEGAKIPISKFGSITIPDVDKIGARGSLNLLGGFLDFGAQKDFGTGEEGIGINFMKKFGGPKDKRVNRKEGGGMSRRQFMKIMGGLAALPIVGKFFKGAKPAAKVAEVATKSTAGQPPEYFFDLAAKIKILGKESSSAPRERMIEVNYKNYSLQEDLVTGDMTIVKRKGDPEFGYEEEVMVLRKGQADETTKGKTPPDEYEELTVRPDPEGKMKDVEDGIEPESVKEIMEEVGQGGGNLDQATLEQIARGRLASGGVAMMLGE